MSIPKELKRLGQHFYQGSPEQVATEIEWIRKASRGLNSDEKRIVKQYLTELLNQNPDGAELQEIWNSMDSDYYVADDEELRRFLSMIRDAI